MNERGRTEPVRPPFNARVQMLDNNSNNNNISDIITTIIILPRLTRNKRFSPELNPEKLPRIL